MNSDRTAAIVVAFGSLLVLAAAAWIYHLYVGWANARDDAAEAAKRRSE
jgi:hypothetical protein